MLELRQGWRSGSNGHGGVFAGSVWSEVQLHPPSVGWGWGSHLLVSRREAPSRPSLGTWQCSVNILLSLLNWLLFLSSKETCSRRKALQYEIWKGSLNTGDSWSRGVAATQDSCGPPQWGHSISLVPRAWGVCVCFQEAGPVFFQGSFSCLTGGVSVSSRFMISVWLFPF